MRNESSGGVELGGAEEQYALLMECVSDYAIFLMDVEGRVAAWNVGAERIFGYSEDEALGMPFARFFLPEDVEQGHPEKELGAAIEHGRATDDRWHVRKDGTRMWVNGITTALRDGDGDLRGFAKVTRDRTEHRKADEGLRERERAYRALADSIPAIVFTAGPDGECDYCNQRWLDYTGLPFEQTRGAGWRLVVHPADLGALDAAWAEANRTGERFECEYRLRRADGAYRWFQGRSLPMKDEQGRAVKWFGNASDIDDQKQTEEALREAERRTNEFLATLAHELRNPLAPIRNAVEVMRLQGRSDAQAEWPGEVIERQVQHLARLVDDLLDVSRIAQGKIRLETKPVELAPVVAAAVEACRPLLDARKQELTVSLAPALRVTADPTRLAQVVGNLVNNAAKYTPEGGHVWLTAEGGRGEAVLRVRDDGIGISAEALPRVFDLFLQAEPGLQHAQGGLGIGLTLVKRLVELHGGTVEAHSGGPGQGSEFLVRLPCLAEAPPAPEEKVPRVGALIRSRRVLVVDDNVDAAVSLAMLLRLASHEVHVAHDGATALQAAHAFRPDVVLLDIGLPGGMTGLDLAPRLRQVPGLERVLLAALTGYGQEEDRRRALEAGFDVHLLKPADLDVLHALLAE